jgi:hypothetical protein
MSFSQELSLKISLDTSKAEAQAQKLTGVMQQVGQKTDAAFSGLNGTKKITEAINQEMFKQLSTIDKIKSVATQITELSKTKQAYEQGSQAHLEAQLAIVKKQSQLQSLIRKEAKETAAQGSGGGGGGVGGAIAGGMEAGSSGGGGGGGGALQNIGKNIVRRLSFMIAGEVINAGLSMITEPFKRAAKDATDELDVSEARSNAIDKAQVSERGTSAAVLIARTRYKKAEDEVRTHQQTIAEMEGSVGFNVKMANPLDSTYKDVYDQTKNKLKQAKIDQASYEQEIKMTARQLERENALLTIKGQSLGKLSDLQKSGDLTPSQQAKVQLEESEAILNRIAAKSNNKQELQTAQQAVEQAKLNYAIAQRSVALQDANLETQRVGLEDIQNIQKQRKVNAVDIAQIEQESAKRQLDDIKTQKGTRQEIKAAENNLTQKQTALQLAQDAQDYELLTIRNKRTATEEIDKLQRKGSLNAVSSAQIQLKLAKETVELAKTYGTIVDVNNAKASQKQAEANFRAAQMGMQQRQIDVSQSLTEQAAGAGRTFANGRPRPLSETERLARQAAKARQQARDAVLTGAPGEAAYQQQRALGLETSVADRLSFGSSGMQQRITPDSSGIAAEITTSNQLLEAIKNSLTPTVN